MNEIWIEKYRPKKLEDVAGQRNIIERLKAYVASENVPHLIFAGPAGTGKTTSALALSKELYDDTWRQNFHELNASDERGIGIIRGKIKDFARTAPMGNNPFKIIFLDEADSLTSDAQAALRRTIERYTHICRFILSVNYSSKIIEPIQSRCTVFRFRPLQPEDIKNYMRKIAQKEKLEITPDGLETLIYVARGDLRKAINVLQVGASISKKITADLLYETSATAKPEDVKKLIHTALKGDFTQSRNILYELLITYGLSGEDIIKQIHNKVSNIDLNSIVRLKIIKNENSTKFYLPNINEIRKVLPATINISYKVE